ncbi:aldehyde dehydrogenase [Bacillus xiapuensis]|uniref:aldehyde dehydrogenase n=1 Tax=Bacillus xiapuensis TaxID=2014075 RepID=UPI000C23492D|nr:aldehyde dehydrogenase [Bacillus xiapuensis]
MNEWEERADRIVKKQKQFFQTGVTKDLSFRTRALQSLREAIQRYEQPLLQALYHDLRKSEFEAYGTEIGYTLDSVKHAIQNLKKWAAPTKVPTPAYHLPAKSWIQSEPYGAVLIVGPFNYPFQLVIEPLIGAIAAGNCAVIKPSEATPHVSALLAKMMKETFEPEFVQVVEGEKEITSALLHAPFDYIFFTGSAKVGRIVMEAASKHLVPVTLELGGKSPAIIDRTANLEAAAKRIAWGKFVNAGQTCVAPDYLLVHHNVKKEFLHKLQQVLFDFYGAAPQKSPDYSRIVNESHFDRLAEMIERNRSKVIFGGEMDREDLFISPTMIDEASWDDACMQEEIFGPVLPVLSYHELNEAIAQVNRYHPKPLALYIFTELEAVEERVLQSIAFGGGCVNDTLSHVANPYLPFGGIGPSGMNSYHGKYSFDAFSHKKSVLKKSTKWNPSFIFPPYKEKVKWLRKLMK